VASRLSDCLDLKHYLAIADADFTCSFVFMFHVLSETQQLDLRVQLHRKRRIVGGRNNSSSSKDEKDEYYSEVEEEDEEDDDGDLTSASALPSRKVIQSATVASAALAVGASPSKRRVTAPPENLDVGVGGGGDLLKVAKIKAERVVTQTTQKR
jgi:hypothetical protein